MGNYNIAHREIDLQNRAPVKRLRGFLPDERAASYKFLSSGFGDGFRHVNRRTRPISSRWNVLRPSNRPENKGWRINYVNTVGTFRDRIMIVKTLREINPSDQRRAYFELRIA